MMNEPSEPHKESVYAPQTLLTAALNITMPVAKKFTLNYYGNDTFEGPEYTITLEVRQNCFGNENEPYLPLKLTIDSADNLNLIDRCLEVIKAGYISAKGELVIDRKCGTGESLDRCNHLMHVDWFDAVNP